MSALLATLLYATQAVLLLLTEQAFGGMGPAFGGDSNMFLGGPWRMFLSRFAFPLLLLHLLALGVAYAAWGAIHYSCWAALPERYRHTTPERAVGFLFIPAFNFYWAFVSLGRLATGFQAWGDDHPDRSIRPAGGLAVAKGASFIAYWTIAWLPGLASIVCVADAVLFWLYYRAVAFNATQVIAADTDRSAHAAAVSAGAR
jgi:hypothetical protein